MIAEKHDENKGISVLLDRKELRTIARLVKNDSCIRLLALRKQIHFYCRNVESIDSMVEIWNIWRKHKLSTTFPEVNDFIRKKKDQEQLYGQSEDIEDSKDEIIKMLQA